MAEEQDNQKQESFDELYQEFQDKFSIDKLKEMTLEVYTNIDTKEGFSFWILNDIFGNTNYQTYMISLGIYKYKDKPKFGNRKNTPYAHDDTYAWQYDTDRDKAFSIIKQRIIDIATNAKNYSQNQDKQYLKNIENIKLPNQLKWKIAFFYSDKKLIAWYNHDLLLKFVKTLEPQAKFKQSKIFELQIELIEIRENLYHGDKEKFNKDILAIFKKEFNNNEDKTMTDTNNNASVLATKCKELLEKTKNIILHGAPGTGKTYLAKKIAEEMNAEIGFVQFHPSYDYTDFVEGLRPVNDDGSNGQIGFKRRDGVFKEFCARALQNYLDSQKTTEEIGKEKSVAEQINSFVSDAIEQNTEFEIATGNKFKITDSNEKSIYISIPANEKVKDLVLRRSELSALLSSEITFENGNDIRDFFSRKWRTQQDSYIIILYKKIKKKLPIKSKKSNESKIALKNFVFIIDEINRGELSKIFGELFFAIDPSYRGEKGLVSTQYQNLITDDDIFYKGFFVPENVYIIGTMNDIDRSVESMDFAMRRRFTFKEITAKDSEEMLSSSNEKLKNVPPSIIDKLKECMENLNNEIWKKDDNTGQESGLLSSAYHIGAAYFLKFADYYDPKKENKDTAFQNLWDYNLEPLLKEYLRGQDPNGDKLKKLEDAYKSKENNTEPKH